VVNPSFEEYTECPSNIGDINKATGWDSYANSPDYLNSCGTSGFSTPSNIFGYQNASSGNAYAGFVNYMSNGIISGNIREYIGGGLSSPLTVNTKYYVSFKVSLSINSLLPSNGGSSKIGAMFSTMPYSSGNPAPITNNPPIYSNHIISDSLSWSRIFDSFISDSAYQYIILGNFFDNNNTDTLILTNDTICSSYYFVDDVCVSLDSAYCANYTTSIPELQSKYPFVLYPNPVTNWINIDFPLLNVSYRIEIYDVIGKRIFFQQNINSNHLSIDISEISNGLLIIKLLYYNQFYYYKLLKQ